MIRFLLLSFFVALNLSASAQTRFAYNDYSAANKEQIFFDDFNNPNDTLWVDSNDITYIKDGFYHYFSDTGKYIAQDFDVALDSNRNYEIEFTAAVMDYYQSGIIFWGRSNDVKGPSNYWYFYKNGKSAFRSCTSFFNVCDDRKIKGKAYDKFNKYTLRKIDRYYYFYVNGRLRKTVPATPLYGTSFGLGSGTGKQQLAETVFDNISISYLNK